jgi:hypothetical protein
MLLVSMLFVTFYDRLPRWRRPTCFQRAKIENIRVPAPRDEIFTRRPFEHDREDSGLAKKQGLDLFNKNYTRWA